MRGRGVRIAAAVLLTAAVLGLVTAAAAEVVLLLALDMMTRVAQHLLR